ncbi:iron-containing alcohol dehydrogenase [Trichlorobacter lovleyi]|uniref:Iron-containing alcohol dehydrogenase n=1 Tax=Trichlorobacter lovleyi (strain ATCC BAA-1151 / DSM 17278 / SZ) TaxID=398767 RepID=B3EA83_TRIL1|nr:iron-containing alcohol dehydrogenase [Trichlorobacter lovleyi]ACD93911.1 iron-containing alcohol dehydrogenase [Trichlorobacter lovleyi SZ]NTV49144.1 iron-containing alcohol dehydrogenase [Geobacteraceae bacterium]NTW79355.1 iron-containing alcohol dehydrogenase [Geobacteraceae bacterium]
MSAFIIPRKTYHGLGSLENLKTVEGRKAVIVTGSGSMKKFGFLDKTVSLLREAGIDSAVFEGVEADPSVETVLRGVEFFNRENPDLIIGLGGCSAIDAAKAMWVFYEYPEATFEEIIKPFTIKPLRNKARFVAIPSTSGTGTEATCATIITDTCKGIKYPIVSYELTPDIAIVDGELAKSMPPNVTADTGMDALSHDVEAFVAALASPYTDALALDSVRLVFENLPRAYADGNNLEARQAMHDASNMGGMAFSNAILGIVHSIAHQIGGMFGVPHGRANAILMPNVIRFNSLDTDKYQLLAQALGKKTVEDFALEIERLRQSVGIEDSFKSYGIDPKVWEEKLDTMVQNAMDDPCTGTNPRQPTAEEMKIIFERCFNGEVVDL